MERPAYFSPLRYARRMGVYRGVLGGQRRWLVLGGLAFSARIVRRVLTRSDEVVFREVLTPGQGIEISTTAPMSRATRRAARRRAEL